MENGTLKSKDIVPVTCKRRNLSGFGFANIWIGMAIVIAVFSFGANGIQAMSIWGVASSVFVANLIIAVIGSLTGDIGVEHGLSFATYLRAPFGINGVHLPAIARGIVASCWFGINTYIGAIAINYFTVKLVGVDNWFLWFIIFAAVQIINTMLGIEAIDKFAAFAAPVIIIITAWIMHKVWGIAVSQNIDIVHYAGTNNNTTWLITLCANMGMWSALAVDIPNITRNLKTTLGERNWFRRNKNNWTAQLFTLPIIEMFMAIIGAIAFITTGNWNPVEVIQSQASGISYFLLLAMVILAQWTTNTAANLIPPAMCFVNAGARWKLKYQYAVVIAGIIGISIRPWAILNDLFTWLGYFGAFLSAMGGIMLCDYYVIRKRRLNVHDLYESKGQYRYNGGVNLVGMIAWFAGTIVSILFMDYMYLVGLPVGFVVYYVLQKAWYLKKFPQAEVESNYSDDYLGVSAGREWVIEGYENESGIKESKTKEMYNLEMTS